MRLTAIIFAGLLALLLAEAGAEPGTAPETIRVYVSGAIQKTGGYDVAPSMAFISAITQAGGPADFADLHRVKILRPSSPEKNSTTMSLVSLVDYSQIIDGKIAAPALKNGDIIDIPVRPIPQEPAKTPTPAK